MLFREIPPAHFIGTTRLHPLQVLRLSPITPELEDRAAASEDKQQKLQRFKKYDPLVFSGLALNDVLGFLEGYHRILRTMGKHGAQSFEYLLQGAMTVSEYAVHYTSLVRSCRSSIVITEAEMGRNNRSRRSGRITTEADEKKNWKGKEEQEEEKWMQKAVRMEEESQMREQEEKRQDALPKNTKALEFHYKSKEDDLGIHKLLSGQSWNFSFHENIIRSTLFYCNFGWGSKQKTFNVFDNAITCIKQAKGYQTDKFPREYDKKYVVLERAIFNLALALSAKKARLKMSIKKAPFIGLRISCFLMVTKGSEHWLASLVQKAVLVGSGTESGYEGSGVSGCRFLWRLQPVVLVWTAEDIFVCKSCQSLESTAARGWTSTVLKVTNFRCN
uniref:Uncharacterized protein LOC104213395 n=1 Tax=Nicotiana sylvestris TaxID=4096 RepID=A0A1U7V8B7_NICSY|nr:PREDICTED: uncharacterized protein LOC104213395 [Nicotiana sylvestris]